MHDKPGFDAKLYEVAPDRLFSLRDMLEYFAKHGSLRVSDLHLKAAVPPVYRVDGALQRMKSPPLDEATLEKMARAFLSETEWATFEQKRSVDTSYITGTMQFRINAFHENDGVSLAIRALDPTPPLVENVGFPNGVWHDILKRQQG